MRNKLTFLGPILNAFEHSAQRRAQDYLLGLSDRHLELMGLSRRLIEQGPDAWPWRQTIDPLPVPGLSAAMRELNTPNGGRTPGLGRNHSTIGQQAAFGHSEPATKLAA